MEICLDSYHRELLLVESPEEFVAQMRKSDKDFMKSSIDSTFFPTVSTCTCMSSESLMTEIGGRLQSTMLPGERLLQSALAEEIGTLTRGEN